MEIRSVRGVQDIFGNQAEKFQYILHRAFCEAKKYGFRHLNLPVIEFSKLYERNLGSDSDVVSKEIYKFLDRGGEELALRPEFTAGAVRAYLEGGFWNSSANVTRFFSSGPIFRYDRPQKGRYRQHHQINFESFGSNNISEDVQMVLLADAILNAIGLSGAYKIEINSLGSKDTILRYSEALCEYFAKFKSDLSETSVRRLDDKKPLRILDSKDQNDNKISQNAPKINEFYNDVELRRFAGIQEILTDVGIQFNVNTSLVRGLDYYTGIVFEFTTELLGSQSTILAGGRYDCLVEQIGGRNVPAIGFASGIERLILLHDILHSENFMPNTSQFGLFVIPIEPENIAYCIALANKVRQNSSDIIVQVLSNTDQKLGKRIEKAVTENQNASIVIIGKNEQSAKLAKLRNLQTGLETDIDLSNVNEVESILERNSGRALSE